MKSSAFIFIFYLVSMGSYAQQKSDSIEKKVDFYISQHHITFNSGQIPKIFKDEKLIIDSLNRKRINYIITKYKFFGKDIIHERSSELSAKSQTNGKAVPFIRYKLEKANDGNWIMSIIEGHNYW